MRQYFKLTFFHIKRTLKDPKSLLLIILPVFLSLFMSFIIGTSDNIGLGKHGFVSYSNHFDQNIYNHLSKENQGEILDRFDNIRALLEEQTFDVIYEIPADFEHTGKIKALSLDGKIENQFIEEEIIRLWQADQEERLYQSFGLEDNKEVAPKAHVNQQKDYLSVPIMLTLFMIFYMMYINASMFANDLLDMRLNLVLKRSIVSKSSGKAILGSILSAYGIIFLIINILAFLIVMYVNNMSVNLIGLIIGYFIVNVAFTIGYILLLVRIFKDKQLLSAISMGIGIMLVIGPGFLEGTSFESLAMISPFYWTMEGLDYANFFPHGIIILLMAGVLFTAGSFKIEELARMR